MIGYAVVCQLRELADRQHLTAAQIAGELGLDRLFLTLRSLLPQFSRLRLG